MPTFKTDWTENDSTEIWDHLNRIGQDGNRGLKRLWWRGWVNTGTNTTLTLTAARRYAFAFNPVSGSVYGSPTLPVTRAGRRLILPEDGVYQIVATLQHDDQGVVDAGDTYAVLTRNATRDPEAGDLFNTGSGPGGVEVDSDVSWNTGRSRRQTCRFTSAFGAGENVMFHVISFLKDAKIRINPNMTAVEIVKLGDR